MAQRKKSSVTTALLTAAAEEFASVGYQGATLAAIAARAGTAVGNVYRYFPDKAALFDAAVPASLAAKLRRLLVQRVDALGGARDVGALPPDHAYHAVAEELRALAQAQRSQLIILLSNAAGTPHAGFAAQVVDDLVTCAARYGRRAYPGFRLTAARRRALERIYHGFIGHIAAILAGDELAAALAELERYHLAGLRAWFNGVAQ